MVENVLDRFNPITRTYVQTILVLPGPSDPTQEKQAHRCHWPSWSRPVRSWKEWDHIVDEAAQEMHYMCEKALGGALF